MAWESSDRAARLPPDWKQRVNAVWKRDEGRCVWKLPKTGVRCPRKGADVDHIRNDDNHDLRNLRLLCKTHHQQKTQREAWFGKNKRKVKKRLEEPSPGRIR